MAAPPIDDAFLRIAERLADAARPILRRYFRSGTSIIDKADQSPVTRADREAEAAMRTLLEEARPTDGIQGEEYGLTREDAGYRWVLDPLDGTRAFIIGKPLFGTLIALAHEGRPVLGLIDMPILGERYLGALGHASTLNGTPIRTRACAGLGDARLNTTTPAMFTGGYAARFERLRAAALDCHYGGDCYGYALVAGGWLDATAEAGMGTHDYMAMAPLIEGAGGRVSDWQGGALDLDSDGTVLATGDATLHEAALERLRA